MVAIAWVLLILWWFYAWLHGGWFARILAFLALLPVVILVTATALVNLVLATGGHRSGVLVAICCVAAVPVAWFVADLPDRIRFRRHVRAAEAPWLRLPSRRD